MSACRAGSCTPLVILVGAVVAAAGADRPRPRRDGDRTTADPPRPGHGRPAQVQAAGGEPAVRRRPRHAPPGGRHRGARRAARRTTRSSSDGRRRRRGSRRSRSPVDRRAAASAASERFGIYCAPCHGLAGYGDGMVAQARRGAGQEGTWTPPSSFHTDLVRGRAGRAPLQHDHQRHPQHAGATARRSPSRDRWAIVAYVRALQRSQNATVADVPADVRGATLR